MNTNIIVKAYESNKDKFDNVDKLATEIHDIIEKKDNNLNEIKKLYSLVFRNFSSSKLTTNVKVRVGGFNDKTTQNMSEYNFEEIVLNKDGIFSQRKNATNSSNIINTGTNFFRILKQVQAKQDEILPCITKIDKKNLFNNFLKDIQLIEDNIEVRIPVNKNVVRVRQVDEMIKEIWSSNPQEIQFGEGWGNRMRTSNPNLDDMLLTEQLYEEILELFKRYNEAETTALANSEIVLNNLKQKFGDYLILNNLK